MRELQDIERWLQLNGLFINVSKTEVMLFGTLQRLSKVDNFKININGYEIMRATKFKYSGVIFDEHINWNEHVKAIVPRQERKSACLDVCVVISPLLVQILSIYR